MRETGCLSVDLRNRSRSDSPRKEWWGWGQGPEIGNVSFDRLSVWLLKYSWSENSLERKPNLVAKVSVNGRKRKGLLWMGNGKLYHLNLNYHGLGHERTYSPPCISAGKAAQESNRLLRTWDKDGCKKSLEIEICKPQSAMLWPKLDLTEFPDWTQPLPA